MATAAEPAKDGKTAAAPVEAAPAGGTGDGKAAADKAEEGRSRAIEAPGAGTSGAGAGGSTEDEDGIIGETSKVSVEDFFKRAKEKAQIPEYGDTPEAQMHWTRPRRWDVRLWSVRIENTIKDNNMFAFANFIFGGNREEFQVRPDGGSPVIWIAGDGGRELRTSVVQDVPGDGVAADIDFDESFEWHGSYMDLEKQSLRIELWNWARHRVNKFDSYHEELLLNYAKGNILNEVECIKMNRFGKRKIRAQISFKLYFQEIYDFQLTFMSWRATGLRSGAQTMEMFVLGGEPASATTGAHDAPRASLTSAISTASAASAAGPPVGYHLELVAPWKSSWCYCCCWSGGRRFMSRLADSVNGCTDWSNWGGRTLSFRGTASELGSAVLEATVFSGERARDLGMRRAPRGSRRAGVPLCTATVPLKGVLEHGEATAELLPAPWLYQVEGGHLAYKHQSGILHGHVLVEQQPRYRQREDLAGDLDFGKRYLFVRVIKVDRVTTPDLRPTAEIDTFVEVTFDGTSQRTRVRQDCASPHFDEELVFELTLERAAAAAEAAGPGQEQDEEQLWEEIESKGPVHFDLWTQGPISNDHLGSCEAFLSDILLDERGRPQKTFDKMAKDKRQKAEEVFKVRVLRGMKQLSFIWGEGSSSSLFFEMWFLPDLVRSAKLRQVRTVCPMPKSLTNRFERLHERWEQKTFPLCQAGRNFPCTLPSQWQAESHFLPRFLDVIKTPRDVDSRNAICHYVGCIPYVPNSTPHPTLFTPDFFSQIRKGEPVDHALLHASLLLGMGERAFVCLGTTMRRQAHAWVATFERDSSVRFWEPYLGTGFFSLPRRFAHPDFVLGGRLPGRLSEEAIQSEVDRRKRLRLQEEAARGAKGPLVLHALELHPHPLVYADSSTDVHAGARCAACGSAGGSKAYARGFHCRELGCHYDLCWQCAEPHWADRTALDGLTFDPTEPHDFEGDTGVDHATKSLVLPYRTVEVVFNNANCWANLQHCDPKRIFWDVWNPRYWHPFAPKTSGLRPCFQGCRFAAGGRDETWCARQKRQVLQQLQSTLRSRRSLRNLDTTWARSPNLVAFLEAGLQLRGQLDICQGERMETLRQEMLFWEQALAAKTPPRHKFRGVQLHFGFCDPVMVAGEAVNLCSFAEAREKSTQFALALHLRWMPGEVVSLYVFICALHRMTDLEVKEEINDRKFKDLSTSSGSGPTPKGIRLQSLMIKAMMVARTESEEPPSAVSTRPPLADMAASEPPPVIAAPNPPVVNAASEPGVLATAEQLDTAAATGQRALDAKPCTATVAAELHTAAEAKPESARTTAACEPPAAEMESAVGMTLPKPETPMVHVAQDVFSGAMAAAAWAAAATATFSIPWASESPVAAGTALVPGDSALRGLAAGPSTQQVSVPHVTSMQQKSGRQSALSGEALPQEELEGVKPIMSGFSRAALGSAMDLSADSLTARHLSKPGAESRGGLLGNGPLPKHAAGHFFELHIDAVMAQASEGLAVGVTTRSSARVPTALPSIEELEPCWVLGADGAQWDGLQLLWSPCPWRVAQLCAGDQVGVLVTPAGMLKALVNGMPAAQSDFSVPCDRPLFAVAELSGATVGVTLLIGSVPPPEVTGTLSLRQAPSRADSRPLAVESAAAVAEPRQLPTAAALPGGDGPAARPLMRSFHRTRLGSRVALSPDGVVATLKEDVAEPVGSSCAGLLLGDGRLPMQPSGGVAFSLAVMAVRPGLGKGLAVGVTVRPPEGLGIALPEHAEELSPCWLVGYDGAAWDGTRAEWLLSTWAPCDLAVSDVVETQVTAGGQLCVTVNGQQRAAHQMRIPMDIPLFLVVELLGSTRGVSLQPISAGAAQGAASHGSPTLAVKPVKEQMEMHGFCRSLLSKLVTLSADGRSASRARGSEGDRQCVLVGDGPLVAEASGGLAFAVTITAVREGAEGGLALGITMRWPGDLAELPETADELSPAWLVGYDGATWDGVTATWGLSSWDPGSLAVGDIVQLSVTPQSEVRIFVNRFQCAEHKMRIPIGAQLFALVDLHGNTAGVTLVPPEKLLSEQPGALRPAVSVAPMTGFSRMVLGGSLLLSPDGRTATRLGGAAAGSGCVLIGNGALESQPDGGAAFALSIVLVSKGHEEGLLVGVTTRSPAALVRQPATADEVQPCWLVGCDGASWDGITKQWGLSDWDPRSLTVGDTVLISVTLRGELCVSVNGSPGVVHRMHLPLQGSLFALADLQGTTAGVALCPVSEALPPKKGKPEALMQTMAKSQGVNSPAKLVALPASESMLSMRGFCQTRIGRSLVLSKDGRTVTRNAATGSAPQAVLLGDAALERTLDGDVSFTVSLTAILAPSNEGLAVGVTTLRPERIQQLPATADALKPSWLVGYDGATWNGSSWGLSGWRPGGLAVGDAVKVSVCRQGQLSVKVNGASVATHDLGVPHGVPLFALLDLVGSAMGVTLLLPPVQSKAASCPARELAVPGGPQGLLRGRVGNSGGAGPSLVPTESTRAAPQPGPPSPRAGGDHPKGFDGKAPKKHREELERGKERGKDRADRKELKERKPREAKEPREVKEPKEAKVLKEAKEPRVPRDPGALTEPREPRGTGKGKDTREKKVKEKIYRHADGRVIHMPAANQGNPSGGRPEPLRSADAGR